MTCSSVHQAIKRSTVERINTKKKFPFICGRKSEKKNGKVFLSKASYGKCILKYLIFYLLFRSIVLQNELDWIESNRIDSVCKCVRLKSVRINDSMKSPQCIQRKKKYFIFPMNFICIMHELFSFLLALFFLLSIHSFISIGKWSGIFQRNTTNKILYLENSMSKNFLLPLQSFQLSFNWKNSNSISSNCSVNIFFCVGEYFSFFSFIFFFFFFI